MNRLIAALVIAALLTTTVTVYAQNSPVLWGLLYPPVGCTDSKAITGDTDIVIKFKTLEIADSIKNWLTH